MSAEELVKENNFQRAEIVLNKILSSQIVSTEDSIDFPYIECIPMRVKISLMVEFATTDDKN